MEYKTVLKNPETIIEIDRNVKTVNVEIKKKDFRRFCSHEKMRNFMIGGLTILTMISLIAQLVSHLQINTNQKQLQLHAEKIKDLIIAYEIQMQQIKGSDFDRSVKVDRTGVRKGRTVSQHTPHFYLKGQGRRGRATENGIFIWKRPAYRSFDDDDDFSQSDSNHADGSFKKVRIHRTGVYYVFAKVTANGRSRLSSHDQPPMGIVLKKEGNGGREDLDFSWVTQDEKGQDYGMVAHTSEDANYPIDTIEISGLFTLSENDKIYIQVPAETINSRNDRFLSGEVRSRFGAFLVEASSFGW